MSNNSTIPSIHHYNICHITLQEIVYIIKKFPCIITITALYH